MFVVLMHSLDLVFFVQKAIETKHYLSKAFIVNMLNDRANYCAVNFYYDKYFLKSLRQDQEFKIYGL